MFTYVDVVGKGCEGWINLFFDDSIIALIRDVDLAKQIKKNINSAQIKTEQIKNKNIKDVYEKY